MNENSFYSIDRLMEFGLGMAMAQQMVKMMNQTMSSMQVPGSISTMPQPQPITIYIAADGQPVGPLSEQELMNLVMQRKVTKDTLAWMPGMPQWQPIEQMPAILKIIAIAPPPIPQAAAPAVLPVID